MFNRIVVQAEAKSILDEFGIAAKEYQKDYYVADSIEAVSALCYRTVKAGTRIFNLITAEDVMIREDDKVTGLVLNWSAVDIAKIHVDPLTIRSKLVIDATGHDAEICDLKSPVKTGQNWPPALAVTEKSRCGRKKPKEYSRLYKRSIPWLDSGAGNWVVNAVFGLPRMGPFLVVCSYPVRKLPTWWRIIEVE